MNTYKIIAEKRKTQMERAASAFPDCKESY